MNFMGEEIFVGNKEEIKDSPDVKERRKERAKEKIRVWLKDRYNLAFLAILTLGIIIRFYFFFLTKTQALWWDEADYLAYAKNLAGLGIEWVASAKHNSLYSYLAAGIFKVGLGEMVAKFLLQLVPSILSIVLVYLICNEMYKDKKIGLIASFLMSIFWVSLFNTTRFHIDIPGLFFGLLAIYVFWRGYENKKKIFGLGFQWAIPLAAVLVILTYSIRRGYFLFGLFIPLYVVLTKSWKELIKDKYNWIGLIAGLILFFIVEKTIFISQIGAVGEAYFHEELPINFYPLQVFGSFFKFGSSLNLSLFVLFWIGLLLIAGKIALSFGQIKRNNETKSDLFNLLIIVITLAFFIFVLRNLPDASGNFADEPRWYFPLALSAFICISRAGTFIMDHIKPYNKYAGAILLIILIGSGGYYQYKISDDLIKEKVNSYSGIRSASLLLKEISNKDDIVLTMGQPQVEYYSERKTFNAKAWVNASPDGEEHFYKSVDKMKEDENVRYMLISFSEPGYPLWMKNVVYTADGRMVVWEIPFMESRIDFTTGEQKINPEGSYDVLIFRLIDVKEEVFIYEIIRNSTIV